MVNLNPSAILETIRNRINQSLEMQMRPRPRLDDIRRSAGISAPSAPPAPDAPRGAEEASFQDFLNSFISLGVPNPNINSEIDAAVTAASIAHGVDANLIRAIIRAESSYNPNAISHAGAMGLMQLMPATAASLGVTDPFNIMQNVNAGTAYIASLLERFEGNVELALAAYNAGWPRVQQHGGIPPFAETQVYVPRVLGFREEYVMAQYAQNIDPRRR
ncbi:MAG: lytic transglycosylase domain-containing protein [Defluviitaleaceae bacterium]|nr:lytic transglycosylase domain-containing protein [Defluviitaleaceae bacterium]